MRLGHVTVLQVLGEGLLEEFPWQAQVPHQCTLPSGGTSSSSSGIVSSREQTACRVA